MTGARSKMTDLRLSDRSAFWLECYRESLSREADIGSSKSLLYSNDAVHLQYLAQVLDGVGPCRARRVLDAGCGAGASAVLLSRLGAIVTGVDLVPERIDELSRRFPDIEWRTGDIAEQGFLSSLGLFDCVLAIEVLQHVCFQSTLNHLWRLVRAGGRLVACLPNGSSIEVQAAVARFNGRFLAPTAEEVIAATKTLEDVQLVRFKAMYFRGNQTVLPYECSDWNESIDGIPNRVLILITRQ